MLNLILKKLKTLKDIAKNIYYALVDRIVLIYLALKKLHTLKNIAKNIYYAIMAKIILIYSALKKLYSPKDIAKNTHSKNLFAIFSSIFEYMCLIAKNIYSRANVPQKYLGHVQHVTILIVSYTMASIIVSPKFKFYTYAKEMFALLCMYGAILVWFVDKSSSDLKYKMIVGVTACFAPVLFMNEAFNVAIIEIFLIIIIEFSIFEYARGCNLFSGLIPVYVVCDTTEELWLMDDLYNQYKILELILLSDKIDELSSSKISDLKSIDDIKKKLSRLNRLSFFPMPRRIMYFSKQHDTGVLMSLMEISSEFSIPLFKVRKSMDKNSLLNISPISFSDFELIDIKQSEKNAMHSVFKGNQIWVFYDGRKTILDLIYSISLVNQSGLTVLCETEYLAQQLSNEAINCDLKIKIIDLDLLLIQKLKPDILFYNMPIKSVTTNEENLKEALIKNVLYTQKFVEYAQDKSIKHVFVISTMEAVNAKNWIGATQRLGELIIQSACSKKLHTKLSVIRIPESIADKSSIFGKIVSSILSNGCIEFDFSNSDSIKACYGGDIIHPLLKLIVSLLKKHNASSAVHTIIPKNTVHLENFINIICNTFCMRKSSDIKIKYDAKQETMDIEDFLNISEEFDETDIDCVVSTKFNEKNEKAFENPMWNMEQIKSMNTRELISSVFQNLCEKIK